MKIYPAYIRRFFKRMILLIPLLLNACSAPSDPRHFECWTNDVVFIDSISYLLSESPLRDFKDYQLGCGKGGVIFSDFPYPDEAIGEWDKPYTAIWSLSDSTLFLAGVDYSRTAPPTGEATDKMYRSMEEFLGKQFARNEKMELLPSRIISPGSIKADWVNGSFYIKKALTSRNEDKKAWSLLPFFKLTFENGILVSEQELTTQPFTEKDKKASISKKKRFEKKAVKYY